MPKGPQGQKRPADVMGKAVRVTQIAAGEADGKDPAAKALGAKGGRARAAKLTPEERSAIARKAAASRWKTS
ncbi:MAG: RNA-binding protein [Chloroflexi bacterium]|nr:RNA-binding protein [Chloroflexota bacterium]